MVNGYQIKCQIALMILHQQNFVYEVSSDNEASNVHAFSSLTAIFNSDSHQYINHPGNFGKKTYLFYDTVHIMKNIRNNLLNSVRNSSRQSANAEAFAEVYLHFIVFASAIKMPRQLNS